MKKTSLILLTAFAFTTGIGWADSNLQWVSAANPLGTNTESTQTLPAIPQEFTVAAGPAVTDTTTAFGADLNPTTGAGFAQLNDGARPLPLLSMWFFPLLALGVLALRVYGVHRARTLAEQEHQTHVARAKVYQALQQRD